MKLRGLMGIAAAALAISACGDMSPGEPGIGGTLSLVLDAPDDSTGALLVAVSGGVIDSVTSASGSVFSESDASGAVTLLVTGTLMRNTVVATVYVPDASESASYQVTLKEAANRLTFTQRDGATVQVRLTPTGP